MVHLGITKSSGGSIIDIMLTPQVQRKRVPDLGSTGPEGAPLLIF